MKNNIYEHTYCPLSLISSKCRSQRGISKRGWRIASAADHYD